MDDDTLSSEPPDPVPIVMQFLQETGFHDTLAAFEKESNRQYYPAQVRHGGELLRVLDELHQLRIAMSPATGTMTKKRAEDEELLAPGDGKIASTLLRTVDNLHGSNIIAFRWHPTESHLAATASVDRTIKISDQRTGEIVSTLLPHKGPILTIDFHPTMRDVILSGSMDGSVSVTDWKTHTILQSIPAHTKYVVRVRWGTPRLFATAGHDGTCCLYKTESDDLTSFTKVHVFNFSSNVEAIEFSKDGSTLVMAVRGDNYLHYIDVDTFEDTSINMNSNGDDFVSFAVMDMHLSPCGKFLLCSTDRSRLILFRFFSPEQLRNFYGVSNDDLSQPRCAWHPSGKYIYTNSHDNKIYAFDVASQKPVGVPLEGHKGLVRDIHYHPSLELLGSVSYDRTLKLWGLPDAEDTKLWEKV